MPTRYRDAVTGEYVTAEEAKRRPRETVKEIDKPKKPPNGGKKK
ncbi:multidrug transporter [Pseudomonas chlororaphis]|nr:multidrug transporter [Pseudomonas sp. FW306-2-2C-D06C]PYC31115.1 multidrug transporter [Pseudomonas chlororaphis]